MVMLILRVQEKEAGVDKVYAVAIGEERGLWNDFNWKYSRVVSFAFIV